MNFKRKALIVVIISLAVSVLLVGCRVEETTNADDSLMDGTYVGYSNESRGFTEAKVIIEDNSIADVEITEYDNQYLRKGVDNEYLTEARIERWGDRIDSDILEEYDSHVAIQKEVANRFVEANSTDIDTLTGATSTVDQAVEAVEMALDKAKGQTEFDGRFAAASDRESRGWGIAIVTVEDGDIVEVELEEVTLDEQYGFPKDSSLKGEDYHYDAFHEAKEELPAQFVEANSPEVDIYSGATSSSSKWQQAVARSLAKAGVYERVVGASEESRGFTKAEIILDGDEFVDVGINEYTNLGEIKGVDTEYLTESRIESWGNRIDSDILEEYSSHVEMQKELANRISEANSTDIDILTGATSTTNQAVEAVENALADGPIDGRFMGVSSVSSRDGWGVAMVTVENGEIEEVELEEVQQGDDGPEFKDEDYHYDDFHQAKEELSARFVESNSAEIDVYSGATSTSNLAMEVVEAALENAGL